MESLVDGFATRCCYRPVVPKICRPLSFHLGVAGERKGATSWDAVRTEGTLRKRDRKYAVKGLGKDLGWHLVMNSNSIGE
jgi:hypothetical protein